VSSGGRVTAFKKGRVEGGNEKRKKEGMKK